MPDQSPNEPLHKPTGGRLSAPQAPTGPDPTATPDRPSDRRTTAHCGEECADGHTQASRCTKPDDRRGIESGTVVVGRAATWLAEQNADNDRSETCLGSEELARELWALDAAAPADDRRDSESPFAEVLRENGVTREQFDAAFDAEVSRERYAAAIWEDNHSRPWTMTNEHEQKRYRDFADAAMAVADAETAAMEPWIRHVEDDNARLRGERDRARDAAVALENQLAAVRDLHQRDDSNPAGPWCNTCTCSWPCRTAQAIDGGQP